jgi:hypothetical protein
VRQSHGEEMKRRFTELPRTSRTADDAWSNAVGSA